MADDIDWKILPSLCLECIFSKLTPAERSVASLTCRSWAKAFEIPQFWKVVTLRLHNGLPCFNIDSIIRRFSCYFKDLKILCTGSFENHMQAVLQQNMKKLFQLMIENDVQLNSLHMLNLNMLEDEAVKSKFFDFLRSQNSLTVIDFENGKIGILSGIHCLQTLTPLSVLDLNIINFFKQPVERLSEPNWRCYVETVVSFKNLLTLSINYRYITGGVLDAISENLLKLDNMNILMDVKPVLYNNGISEHTWNKLKHNRATLSIHLSMTPHSVRWSEGFDNRTLSPAMPITALLLDFKDWYMDTSRIIFSYFSSSFSSSLKSCTYILKGFKLTDVESGIAEILNECMLLEKLELKLSFLQWDFLPFFTGLCTSIENLVRTKLSEISLVLYGLNQRSRRELMGLKSLITQRLMARRVFLVIKTR